MKILEQSVDVSKVPYMRRFSRMAIYGLVGIILVYISEPDDWLTLHTYDLYPLALMVSMGLAIIIGEYIHYITLFLDKRASWLRGMSKRWLLQLLLGFVVPIGLAVGGIYWYYAHNGYSFAQSTYFERIFYLIFSLLLLATLYYQMRFSNYVNGMVAKEKNAQIKIQEAERELISAQENVLLAERAKAQKALLPKAVEQISDILLFYATNRFVLYCTNNSNDVNWDFTITDTIETLPDHDFYRINKGVIVARVNIEAVYKFTATTYQVQLTHPAGRMVTVSQRERKGFKSWYGAEILPKRETM